MTQQNDRRQDIAVIGIACRFPGADNVEEYWANLVNGVDSITRVRPNDQPQENSSPERFVGAVGKLRDVECFDADYFRVTPAEAVTMDPQQRILLEVAAAALEDAGYADDRGAANVGVFVGGGENEYFHDHVMPTTGLKLVDDIRLDTGNRKDFLAPRLAFKLGLTGPSITVQASCATGLAAVALACSALAVGDCDLAIAGGVSLIMPDVDGYTYAPGGILSADGYCRPFDAAASGTVPGSGAGVVVLKRDENARADRDSRRAVIRGWAVNNDGGSRAGFTVPNAAGQEAVIRRAMARAGVTPDSVRYVETHGTATAIGDAVEIEALRRVFVTAGAKPGSCVLGSVKPNIGHADAASGVAGLIKAILAVERGAVPATLHFTRPNPEIELTSTPFTVTNKTVPWVAKHPRLAGISSFGLGGNNTHAVIEQASPVPSGPNSRSRHVIALSARTSEDLHQARTRLAAWLAARPQLAEADLADVAFSLAVGRQAFPHRWATAATNAGAAIDALRAGGEPVRTTTRWSLHIHGGAADLAAMGRRETSQDPLLDAAVRGMTDDAGSIELLPGDVGAGVVTALAALRALQSVGLRFARVHGPSWLQPALRWLTEGAASGSLEAVLAQCAAGDTADTGIIREGPGTLLVGPSFVLAEAVATAWVAGASIDWPAFYRHEQRGRVSLPTYPFSRRRFWLDRPRQRPDTRHSGTARQGLPSDVRAAVEKVWREVLGLDEIAPEAHFVDDLGGDSMYAVEIGARLTDDFRVDLPIDLPFVAPTVIASADFVNAALAKEISDGDSPPGVVT